MLRSIPVAVALAVTLVGCSPADPEAALAEDVEAVIAEANDKDSRGVRDTVDELLQTISRLGGTGKLTPAREAELRALALGVLENVALLDAQPSPSPSPSPPAKPTPSPTPKPSPSPSPSPTEKDDDDDDDDKPPSPSPEPGKGKGNDKSPLIILPSI